MSKVQTSTQTDAVVGADWVDARLDEFERNDDDEFRLLEVDFEPEVYDDWHLPGATVIDWERDLGGKHGQAVVDKDGFEALLGSHGITAETTVVIYGDKANWFAAHAYWLFTYYGHENVALLDGGRHYWDTNEYPTTTTEGAVTPATYDADTPDDSIRAFRDDVKAAIEEERSLIDVRSPKEYRGGETAPPGVEESTETGGHIPTAENVPWASAIRADGRFKPVSELAEVYSNAEDDAVAYCRIGERSSLTWFVLHELLGYDAANYDGSWTDWTSQEDADIERGNQ